MAPPLLFDIVESPTHPDLSALSDTLGYQRLAFNGQRKAIAKMKQTPPDVVVADFFYGYGNNYAGANVSNLDVLLRSLQRFAPASRVVILADRSEIRHIDKLKALFKLDTVVALPATLADLEQALT
ncbi:hypothetical protein [Thiosocius teredinicola]|uniref:hypothetical protein n=1 Tax=Thiosocius teredinicola TaxID=1973002 RepID=UPI000990D903